MEFTVESIGPCKKKISVSISVERIHEELDKKYDEINDAVAMPGFRPGRAPRKLLERRFGSRLGEEMRADLVKAAIDELVEKENVEFLAAPDIDVESLELVPDKAFEFEFEAVTKPEFETPEFKGLEVKVPPVTVSDDEIDAAIEGLLRRGATLETEENAEVAEDDVLIVDWQAKDGDSVEARDSNVYYPFGKKLLAGFYVEDLDEQLDGKAVGATATSTVQVAADDPREELRGKDLTLEVELKEVKRYVLPEIDAAFLETHDFDDVDELREDVSKQISRQKRRQIEHGAESKLIEQLLDDLDIDLPDDFVEHELEHWASRKRMELEMQKIEEEEIAKEVDSGRGDARQAIERDMQRFFLLDRIATAEGLEVTETEMLQAIQEIATAYGRPIEEVLGSFRDGGRMSELQSQIRHRKASEALRAAATLVEDPSLAEEDEPKQAKKKKAAKKKAAKQKPAAKKKASKKKAAKKKADE